MTPSSSSSKDSSSMQKVSGSSPTSEAVPSLSDAPPAAAAAAAAASISAAPAAAGGIDDETASKKAAAAAEDLKELAWRCALQQEAAAAAAGGVDAAEAGRGRGRGSEKNFSRIKKLLNRLKHLTDKDSSMGLLEEIRSLNLDLFLSELASCLAEAELKPSALKAATEVVLELSRAYPDFPGLFASALDRSIEALRAAFAASADAVPAEAVAFTDSSCLLSPDAAAKQQQLGSRLRLLLRFTTDLLLLDVLPLSLEPLLLRLVRLAAATPPKQTDHQQQQQLVLDRANEAAWPSLSADHRNRSSGGSPAAADAAAAAGVLQGRWMYSPSLCLCRLQALGGAFCRKAAQLLLTQQQQQQRLAAAVSLCLRRQAKAATPFSASQETDAAKADEHASPAAATGAPADATPPPAAAAANRDAAAAAAGVELDVCFESLTPTVVQRAVAAEGLSLSDAEAALAALRLPRNVPSPACRAQLFSSFLSFYLGGCLPVLHALQRELLQQEARNLQQAVDRGVVGPEGLSRASALADRLKAALVHAGALAELLQQQPPDAAEIERAALATVEGGNLLLGVTRLGKGSAAAAAQGGQASFSAPFGIAGEDDPAWRTKEERLFYTEVLDLYEVLPSGMLGGRDARDDKTKAAAEQQAAAAKAAASAVTTAAPPPAAAPPPPASSASKENPAAASAAAAAATAAAAAPATAAGADAGEALAAFLSRLPQATTQQQIDQLAVDFFLERLNTKPNRAALARTLLHASRQQLHLLPTYARLLAILRKPLKEETGQVLEALQNDLKRFLQEHDPEKIESKVRCIRYVSECTKFRLFPPGLLLNALSSLLEDLTPHRIEMIVHLAAGCGYFLLHSPLTGQRFRALITRMLRLSVAKHLPPEQECLLQDTYYQLCGPETREGGSQPAEKKETLQLFIEKLLFEQLYGSEEDAAQVAALCRKLPWVSNPQVSQWFRDCLLELGDHANFELVHRHAALLSALAKYIPGVVISCVDGLLESMQYGMERADPEDAPKRLLQARLLGELYNYRLVDSSVFFDALYNLIGFGGYTAFQAGNIRTTHRLLFEGARTLQQQQQQRQQQQEEEVGAGWAAAAVYAQLPLPLLPPPPSPPDPPSSTTRMKMVLQILEVSGKYYHSGKPRLKLDRFLVFFERYCRHKAETGRVDWGEVGDALRRLRPHRQPLETSAAADAAAAHLLQEEARILQTLGEGPVEENRDETALYGESEGSEAAGSESVDDKETLEQQEETEKQEPRRGAGSTAPDSEEEDKSSVDSFDAEFAAAMEEAAEEVRSSRSSGQQQPVRLPWGLALKEAIPQGSSSSSSKRAAAEETPEEAGPACSRGEDSDESEEEGGVLRGPTVTLRLLQRRPEKRGKVQLKTLTVPARIPLLQQQQQQQGQQQQQQQHQRAGVELLVLDSVMGVAKPAPKAHAAPSRKSAIRAANARVPGLATAASEPNRRSGKNKAPAAASAAAAAPAAAAASAADAAAEAAASVGDKKSK